MTKSWNRSFTGTRNVCFEWQPNQSLLSFSTQTKFVTYIINIHHSLLTDKYLYLYSASSSVPWTVDIKAHSCTRSKVLLLVMCINGRGLLNSKISDWTTGTVAQISNTWRLNVFQFNSTLLFKMSYNDIKRKWLWFYILAPILQIFFLGPIKSFILGEKVEVGVQLAL